MHKPKRLPVIREDRTIEIPLTKGYVAIVDWEDAWVCGGNWSALETPSGHIYASCNGRLLHRQIMGLGARDGNDVDHMNGDTMNCRRSNLRVIPHRANCQNREPRSRTESGQPGVYWRSRISKWCVKLGAIHVGEFVELSDAIEARLSAEREHWGIHPRRAYSHREFIHKNAYDLT